jgi:hypothetical protein
MYPWATGVMTPIPNISFVFTYKQKLNHAIWKLFGLTLSIHSWFVIHNAIVFINITFLLLDNISLYAYDKIFVLWLLEFLLYHIMGNLNECTLKFLHSSYRQHILSFLFDKFTIVSHRIEVCSTIWEMKNNFLNVFHYFLNLQPYCQSFTHSTSLSTCAVVRFC